MIRAIETNYRGYKMRSRLEARWAVFFDRLGIEWEYEKEGYDLGSAGWYLPDFWLPQVSMWAEVKAGAFSEEESNKCRALANMTACCVLQLDGTPTTSNYWACAPDNSRWDDDPNDDGPLMVDYILQEGHRYWEHEHRFFSCSGASYPNREGLQGGHQVGCLCSDCDMNGAVAAARSARFEHGETP